VAPVYPYRRSANSGGSNPHTLRYALRAAQDAILRIPSRRKAVWNGRFCGQSLIFALALLLCAACGGQAAPPAPAAPSPTIAALVRSPTPAGQPARPSPSPANPAAQPTSATNAVQAPAAPAGTPAAGQASAPEPTIYLWPSDLPPELRVAPKESRVAADGEVGPNGLGFYIVTLNAGDTKVVVGGGDLGDALPLVGDEHPVTVGQRSGKLITKDQQREVVLDISRGKLFIYSLGLSEQELLRIAGSLQPIDVKALREMVGSK